MSRLIDADLLKAEYLVPSSTTNTSNWLYVSMETINNAPTIDAVEVVRCKDCKFYEKGHGCDLLDVFMINMDNWFCADGERREEP